MTLREKTVNIGLGVPVFVTVAGVAEEAVVAEAFKIAIFYAEGEPSVLCYRRYGGHLLRDRRGLLLFR